MDVEKIHRALLALECDAQINRMLLCELIAQSPNREELLQRFQREVDDMTLNAPPDIDPEQVVELRARAEQTVLLVRRTPPYPNESR